MRIGICHRRLRLDIGDRLLYRNGNGRPDIHAVKVRGIIRLKVNLIAAASNLPDCPQSRFVRKFPCSGNPVSVRIHYLTRGLCFLIQKRLIERQIGIIDTISRYGRAHESGLRLVYRNRDHARVLRVGLRPERIRRRVGLEDILRLISSRIRFLIRLLPLQRSGYDYALVRCVIEHSTSKAQLGKGFAVGQGTRHLNLSPGRYRLLIHDLQTKDNSVSVVDDTVFRLGRNGDHRRFGLIDCLPLYRADNFRRTASGICKAGQGSKERLLCPVIIHRAAAYRDRHAAYCPGIAAAVAVGYLTEPFHIQTVCGNHRIQKGGLA